MSDEIPRDLSRLYRAGASAEPPARLDATILRSARQESAASTPYWRGTSAARWGLPMALAAVMVLSVSLVLVMREEQPGIESDALVKHEPDRRVAEMSPSGSEVPAKSQPLKEGSVASVQQSPAEQRRNDAPAAAQRPQAKAEESASANYELSRGSVGSMRQRVEEADRKASSPEATMPPAASAPPAVTVESDLAKQRSAPASGAIRAPAEAARDAAVPERREAKRLAVESPPPPAPAAVGSAAPATRAPVPAVAGAAEKSDASGAQLGDSDSPEPWLKRIAQLRKEGRASEAQASLEEFRKRYPSYPVPEALR